MPTIACLGSSSGSPGVPAYDAMVAVGRLLAKRKVTVATGGLGGIGMEAPARGAREVGGDVDGYTMWSLPPNEFVTQHFPCVDNEYRLPEVELGIRQGRLMAADGFILAYDGWGPGTVMELLGIINFNIKLWIPRGKPKRFAILKLDDKDAVTPYITFLIGSSWEKAKTLCRVTESVEGVVNWVLGGNK